MSGYNNDGIFTGGICEKVLSSLADFTSEGNRPFFKRTKLGFMQFLKSEMNMGGIEVIPVKPQGSVKRKTVRVKYLQRAIESQVRDSASETCVPEDFDDYCETEFDVTQESHISWGMDEQQFKYVCTDTDTFVREILLGKLDALAKKINKNVLTTQSTNFGTNVRTGLTTATSTNVFPTATGAPLALALQDIWQDYTEFNEYTGMPAVIGQGDIHRYTKTLNAGCCNDGGVDMFQLSEQMGYGFWLDTTIESILGADQFAVIAPGTTQLVNINLIDADTAYNVTPISEKTVITDPVTGMDYDFKVEYDTCKSQFFFELSAYYDLWNMPSDTYNASDDLFGTNGTLRYQSATT